MAFRDHFHPPLTPGRSWDELHGSWLAMIVQALRPHLPPGYIAAAQVHLGSAVEFDVGAYRRRDEGVGRSGPGAALAVAVAWPLPTLSVSAGPDDLDVYEVRVTRISGGRRLVAVVEIVSPSNKDRPDSRRAFVTKCATLLRDHVSVVIVDVVTDRRANLYVELLAEFGHDDPATVVGSPAIYAAACRLVPANGEARLETWFVPLRVGGPLPTLPLWLEVDLALVLDLAESYEQTCYVLQIEDVEPSSEIASDQ